MFTGIIEELGYIQKIEWREEGAHFCVRASLVLENLKLGDSLCLNGCCLTVTGIQSMMWTCDVVQETLNRTGLKYLKKGDPVNLERAVTLQNRLGGHLVQGHIDGTGQITDKKKNQDGSSWVTIMASPQILRYAIYKGSIAVDGVSLTIAQLEETNFSFAMIPHTSHMTTLGFKLPGDIVNLEADLVAKYIEKFVSPGKYSGKST